MTPINRLIVCMTSCWIIERIERTDGIYMINTTGLPKSIRALDLDNEKIMEKVGFANFTERTVRAFKLDDLEDICEDYGQVAVYNGSIPGHPHYFDLDDHHRFFTGKPMLVCGNTASMVSKTRFSSAFKVIGDRTTHFGAFDGCGTQNTAVSASSGGSCCC